MRQLRNRLQASGLNLDHAALHQPIGIGEPAHLALALLEVGGEVNSVHGWGQSIAVSSA